MRSGAIALLLRETTWTSPALALVAFVNPGEVILAFGPSPTGNEEERDHVLRTIWALIFLFACRVPLVRCDQSKNQLDMSNGCSIDRK